MCEPSQPIVEVVPFAWPESLGSVAPTPGAAVGAPGPTPHLLGSLRPLLGPLDPVVAGTGAPEPTAAGAPPSGPVPEPLPPGAARGEAEVARLRLGGARLVWGHPRPVGDLDELEGLSRARGRSSVAMIRCDPRLTPLMQVGSWFNAGWRVRAVRRATRRGVPAVLASLRRRPDSVTTWRLVADVAFWAGVRDAASDAEWRRLTASSYVVFAYHRLAGEGRPGQEQLDCSPVRFAAHVRMLRRLGYHPLTVEEVERFHRDPGAVLPRRSFLATFDDAYEDNAEPLLAATAERPVLFAPTARVGGPATFAAGEPLLDWDALARLEAAGVGIGSHSRSHPVLPDLDEDAQRGELSGSRRDLAEHLDRPLAAVAYPHGRHDAVTLRAAAEAGYGAGFTTDPGRNGAGTHPLCLRRVGVWRGDNRAFLLWKAVTGEYVPGQARTEGRGWLTPVRLARRRDRNGAAGPGG